MLFGLRNRSKHVRRTAIPEGWQFEMAEEIWRMYARTMSINKVVKEIKARNMQLASGNYSDLYPVINPTNVHRVAWWYAIAEPDEAYQIMLDAYNKYFYTRPDLKMPSKDEFITLVVRNLLRNSQYRPNRPDIVEIIAKRGWQEYLTKAAAMVEPRRGKHKSENRLRAMAEKVDSETEW